MPKLFSAIYEIQAGDDTRDKLLRLKGVRNPGSRLKRIVVDSHGDCQIESLRTTRLFYKETLIEFRLDDSHITLTGPSNQVLEVLEFLEVPLDKLRALLSKISKELMALLS